MIRILLCFLFFEICFCSVDDVPSHSWKSLGRPLSSDGQHARRYARDLPSQKKFGEKGNYITTVVYVDLPTFSDSVDVGDVSDDSGQVNIQYNHVRFSKPSSIYALGYRIDLSANVVQLVVRLGKAQITGTYSVKTPGLPNSASQDFELNLYADLIYTHEVLFQVDERGRPSFGKTENPRLLYKKVKGKYTNPPSSLAALLENYLGPNLLKAVVAKIYDEVRQKVSLNDVSFQIESEIAFRRRYDIADRFKKAITDAFEDVHENAYNVFYFDRTNYNKIVQSFDVRIPSFVLRKIEGYEIHDVKISFVGDHVRARVQFAISSPLALFRIVYRNKDDLSAQNKTVRAEFQMSDVIYEVEIDANPETNAVEFRNAALKVAGVKVASTQGLYEDERDSIIEQLTPYIKSYVQENGSSAFGDYVKGLLAEGRIAHQVFN